MWARRRLKMGPNEYLKELGLAIDEYRFRDVRCLTDKIDPGTFEMTHVKKVLKLIRRKRLFAELEHVTSLFQMSGNSASIIRIQWCQSLLDQNRINQALTTLESLRRDFGSNPVEGPEIRGLIGRAYKQQYINEGGKENLKSAIEAYLTDWSGRQGDYRWQGINLVALLLKASHDGIDLGYTLNPSQIAQNLLKDIEDHEASGFWDYATAMEASIALDDETAALLWAKKYVQHPDTDAFELGSTLRQLKEVWNLENTKIGNKLLPVLEYALLQKEGGTVRPSQLNKVLDENGFEAVWGTEAYTYLQWIDTLYRNCNAIARISDAATGGPKGTGFLIKGNSLNPAWGDIPVFLTNAHVISVNPADEAPLRAEEAKAEFTRLPGRPKVSLGELLFSSPRFELDVSIFRIDPPNGYEILEPYPYLPNVSLNDSEPQRIYVVGHPGGTELAISLYDNSLAEYENQFVRYRSPTEGGHSGSPVFTRQIKAFAVHHRALYDRQLNEGVVMNAIIEALERS